ncbi:MAG: protein kinase [Myxococcales bacterium]|nr:protein kinase [Myxococcales bacterium]
MAGSHKTCRVCGAEYGEGELFCPADGTRLGTPGDPDSDTPADPLIGDTLGERYRIIRVIGEGGMGIVYEAEHLGIGAHVAVKVLRADFTTRPDVVERFRREARGASKIGHPNIVTVTDFGETRGGASYFAMELLKGEDLADMLARETAVSPARAADIAHQVCQALGAAHAQGIVHRDLKPENMFVVPQKDGRQLVKIVDFGVAKISDMELTAGGPGRRLTRTGMVFGTPEYMSPEQARGIDLDERVDVYALGVIMFELVTGRVPFEGDNFMELLNKHATSPVPALTSVNPGVRVSDEFSRVIHRALHKDRAYRYPTMSAMAQDLLLCPEMSQRRGGTSSAPPLWSLVPPPAVPGSVTVPSATEGKGPDSPENPRSQRWSARRRWAAGLALAAVVLLGVAGLWPQRASQMASNASSATRPPAVEGARIAKPAPRERVDTPVPPEPASGMAPQPLSVVSVTSQPPGASVTVKGMGEVCEATPCTVSLPRQQRHRLLLRAGRAKGSAKVLPTKPRQAVHVVLRAPRSVAGELKVPRAFLEPHTK